MGIKADTRADSAVLDAAKRCTERWGMAKVTIDDIATEAGVSRATIYRLFPGGKDVLFDALRVRETEDFLVGLRDHVADATTLEELLVRTSCTPRTNCAPTSTSPSCSPRSPARSPPS